MSKENQPNQNIIDLIKKHLPGNAGSNDDDIRLLSSIIEKQRRGFRGSAIVNPINFKRYLEIIKYLSKGEAEGLWEVTYYTNNPQDSHADISISFVLLDFVKDQVTQFAQIIGYADVLGVQPTADGRILMDLSINYVWEARSHE